MAGPQSQTGHVWVYISPHCWIQRPTPRGSNSETTRPPAFGALYAASEATELLAWPRKQPYTLYLEDGETHAGACNLRTGGYSSASGACAWHFLELPPKERLKNPEGCTLRIHTAPILKVLDAHANMPPKSQELRESVTHSRPFIQEEAEEAFGPCLYLCFSMGCRLVWFK